MPEADDGESEWLKNRRYGISIDSGSSGSRLYVYSWRDPLEERKHANASVLAAVPSITAGTYNGKHWHKKIHPGISTFAEDPQAVGANHLAELLEFAKQVVPQSQHRSTPIFLSATAGMRMLPEYQQKRILQSACKYIKENTSFLLRDCKEDVTVISGVMEGLYGWLSVNYLSGRLSQRQNILSSQRHTTGFLDMGGASVQIAFAPNSTEAMSHDDDLMRLRLRTLNGQNREWRVYVSSWLGLGANQARDEYLKQLSEGQDMGVVEDPCLPEGKRIPSSEGGEVVGSGALGACLDQLTHVLDHESSCMQNACLLAGAHAPQIDFHINQFIGISEYYHLNSDVFDHGGAYDYVEYYEKVSNFCRTPWDELVADLQAGQFRKNVDEATLSEFCFKSAWMMSVLHSGFGLPREPSPAANANMSSTMDPTTATAHFRGAKKISGFDVSWTLGKMLLYVSSTVPVSSKWNSLPVGVGTANSEFGRKFPDIRLRKSLSMLTQAGLLLALALLLWLLFLYLKRRRILFRVMSYFTRRRQYRRVMRAGGSVKFVPRDEEEEDGFDDDLTGEAYELTATSSRAGTFSNRDSVSSDGTGGKNRFSPYMSLDPKFRNARPGVFDNATGFSNSRSASPVLGLDRRPNTRTEV